MAKNPVGLSDTEQRYIFHRDRFAAALGETRKWTRQALISLKVIKDEELWRQEYDSWNAFLGDPKWSFGLKYGDNLLRAYTALIVEKKISPEKWDQIPVRKLELLGQLDEPEKYVHDAIEKSESDLREDVREKLTGETRGQGKCRYWAEGHKCTRY